MHFQCTASSGPPAPLLSGLEQFSSGWRVVVSKVWEHWSRGAGETHLGRLVCAGNSAFPLRG